MSRYLNAILAVVLLSGLGLSHWKAYSHGKDVVQAKFDDYKGAIDDQVQKENEKAATIKLVQEAKFALAKSAYAADTDRLNAAIARLRKSQAVPRNESVPVAGCSTGSMPAQAVDTSGAVIALAATRGICDTDFYAKAMKEHLQCSRLIEFVK